MGFLVKAELDTDDPALALDDMAGKLRGLDAKGHMGPDGPLTADPDRGAAIGNVHRPPRDALILHGHCYRRITGSTFEGPPLPGPSHGSQEMVNLGPEGLSLERQVRCRGQQLPRGGLGKAGGFLTALMLTEAWFV